MKVLKKHRLFLIACAIGDGYIDKQGRITVFHSEKQKEYVEYKFNQFKHLVTKSGIRKRISNGTVQYGFSFKTTKYTKLLRKILYPQGRKTIPLKVIKNFGAEELALWWMDDGSCSVKYNKNTGNIRATVSTLCTQLSKEENQVIIDWIYSTFKIKFGQRRMKNQYSLICGTKEGRKLAKILKPYIIPSMFYKLSK